jgi:hypothetical protein
MVLSNDVLVVREASKALASLAADPALVGLYKLNPVETHSLKAPGFNP